MSKYSDEKLQLQEEKCMNLEMAYENCLYNVFPPKWVCHQIRYDLQRCQEKARKIRLELDKRDNLHDH